MYAREIWYWDDKNKIFKIVDNKSKLFLSLMGRPKLWGALDDYYDLGKFRFRLLGNNLEIKNMESFELFQISMKSYYFRTGPLTKYRIFAHLQDVHFSGFFFC